MNNGIIFEGDSSPMAAEAADRLRELGYYAYSDDEMNRELLDSLNSFRRAYSLTEQSFCDPVTLRALGIEADGDEIITLARCAYSAAETELDCYDICLSAVAESRKLGITITEAALRRFRGDTEQIPPYAVGAAILALLNE